MLALVIPKGRMIQLTYQSHSRLNQFHREKGRKEGEKKKAYRLLLRPASVSSVLEGGKAGGSPTSAARGTIPGP